MMCIAANLDNLGPLGVNLGRLSQCEAGRLYPQAAKVKASREIDDLCQDRPSLLQQSQVGFESAGQACSSLSEVLASLRSSVSKPSVNQP